MLDDKIIVTGIDPKSRLHSLLQIELAQLLDEAPSDSCIRFKLLNEAEGSISIASIYSQQGYFNASTNGSATEEAQCSQLCEELRRQLQSWREKRFQTAG